MTQRPPGFDVKTAPLDGAPGVQVSGEVDIETAPRLAEAIEDALRDTHGAFVVDLCDVEFLDSSGVSVFVRMRALLGREDRQLVIVCPPGAVLRIFEVAGIADLFVFFDTRDEAASALQPAD